MSAINAEAMSHFDLRQPFLDPQLPDTLAEPRSDLAGHAPIVRCRLWPTYRQQPTGALKLIRDRVCVNPVFGEDLMKGQRHSTILEDGCGQAE